MHLSKAIWNKEPDRNGKKFGWEEREYNQYMSKNSGNNIRSQQDKVNIDVEKERIMHLAVILKWFQNALKFSFTHTNFVVYFE